MIGFSPSPSQVVRSTCRTQSDPAHTSIAAEKYYTVEGIGKHSLLVATSLPNSNEKPLGETELTVPNFLVEGSESAEIRLSVFIHQHHKPGTGNDGGQEKESTRQRLRSRMGIGNRESWIGSEEDDPKVPVSSPRLEWELETGNAGFGSEQERYLQIVLKVRNPTGSLLGN